jgi:hypothetical protein
MNSLHIFYGILLPLTLYSCTKSNTQTGLLIGNWTVINYSILNTNAIYVLPAGDSGISTNNYNGEQYGATFNFNSNGTLRISFSFCIYGFGPIVDSADFIIKDNQVAIFILAQGHGPYNSFNPVNPVVTRTYSISNLTVNTATLTFQIIHGSSSPSAVSAIEIINLKK